MLLNPIDDRSDMMVFRTLTHVAHGKHCQSVSQDDPAHREKPNTIQAGDCTRWLCGV